MKKTACLVAIFFLAGCQTMPVDVLKLGPDVLAKRQLQTRQFDTKDEEKILSACAGVLQDLGFTVDETEAKLGLIVGSKDRDAVDSGQVAFALTMDVLAALAGSYSNNYSQVDSVQKIRASVVCAQSQDGAKTVVRVIFQRIVWNKAGNVSKLQNITDASLYQGFFEQLSKSVFLEGQNL